MRRFAPYASTAILFLVAGCGGFTSIGDGAGAAAGMGNAAGMETGGTGADGGKGSGGSAGKGGKSGTGGTGMTTGGTGGTGMTTGGTGGTGMAGTAGGGYEPCSNKACGATCTLCDPNDKSCVEDLVVKYCDASGGCGINFPVCVPGECTTVDSCPQPAIACSPCADGTMSACPTTDCVMGKCVTTYPTCPSPECMVDDECPVSKAPCQLCADGSTACPWAHCDGGKCTSGIDSCDNTDPCKGKSCGDTCTTCPPDGGCVAVAMFCDESLNCQLNTPMCTAPQCKEDQDCLTDVCGLCDTTGGCASQVCTDGKCGFSCPPKMDLCGGCASDQICVHQVGGPGAAPADAYHCDKVLLCPGANPCSCITGASEGMCEYKSDSGGHCECDNGLE